MLCALTGALLPIPAPVMAASPDGGLRIRLASAEPQSGSAAESITFELAGQAWMQCVPSLTGAAIAGSDVDVRLHWPSTACIETRTTRFTLTANFAALTGASLPRGQVYRLRVFDQDGNLLAFRLFETDRSRSWPAPENGFWWPQAADGSAMPVAIGSGVAIESQGMQLAVNAFGYGDLGNPVWYFGGTRQNGRVASVPLVELRGGESLFSAGNSQPKAEPGPRLEIEFLSSSQARAWLVQGDRGWDRQVRELRLGRTAFARSIDPAVQLGGRWVLVSSGESPPRQFDFATGWGPTGNDFRLTDPNANAELSCRTGPAQHAADLCSLTVGGAWLADFDRIGLDRLGGHGSDGAAVQLLRIPEPQ